LINLTQDTKIDEDNLADSDYMDDYDRKHPIKEKETRELEVLLPSLFDFVTVATFQKCFARSRKLDVLDKGDGIAMGEMLMVNTGGLFQYKERSVAMRKERFQVFCKEFACIPELKGE